MMRKIMVFCLSLLLILSLFGASGAWALERGPLNADHVTASAEEADVYPVIHEEVHKQIEDEDISLPFPGLEDRIDPIIKSVLTVEWIQTEGERNIDNLYDHLRDGEPLNLTIDLQAREGDIRDILQAELSLQNIGIDRIDRLTADEASYDTERDTMRSELQSAMGVDPDEGFGVPLLQNLLQSEESFDETRTEMQDDIVSQGLQEISADEGFGNDRLALLYEDAAAFETEQQDFRDEQKERIQDETEEELSDEELREAYEDQIPEIIDAAATQSSDRVDLDGGPAAEDRVTEIATLKAEGLATTMSHDEFTSNYDDIVDSISDDILAELADDPSPIADELHTEFEAELAEAGAPEPVAAEATQFVDITVQAITTEMSYSSYQEAYDEAAEDVERAAFEYLSENRAEYDDEIHDAALGDTGLDEIPSTIENEVDNFVDLIIDAVVNDMPYDEFIALFEDRENDLAAAIAEAIFAEEMLPKSIDFSEDLQDEAGNELEMLGTLFGVVLPVAIGLTILSVLLVGGLYFVVQSLATSALLSGGISLIAGITTYIAAIVTPGLIRESLSEIDAPEALTDVVGDLIELAMFAPLASQGLLLVGVGVALCGTGIALRYELIDRIISVKRAED